MPNLRIACLSSLFLVSLGCGETSSDPLDDASRDAAADAPPIVTDAAASPSPGCTAAPLAPGDHDDTLVHDGATYSFRVHVPPTYQGAPTPLVLNVHGAETTIAAQQLFTAMNPEADRRDTLVVYPGSPDKVWNAGGCCGTAADENRDDVAFVHALLEEVSRRVCVDPTRIYATGHSNGAMLVHRLACEASDLFAAVAPVSGTSTLDLPCSPERAIPILYFHGTEDVATPYEGNERFEGVVSFMEGWAARNDCPDSRSITLTRENVTCETWAACRQGAEVAYCTIEGMGHCWPGQLRYCSEPLRSDAISANEAMFDFFERFSRAPEE